jgi:hypothetical protein
VRWKLLGGALRLFSRLHTESFTLKVVEPVSFGLKFNSTLGFNTRVQGQGDKLKRFRVYTCFGCREVQILTQGLYAPKYAYKIGL